MTTTTNRFATMMKSEERQARLRLNAAFDRLLKNKYFDGLPLDQMFSLLRDEEFTVDDVNLLGVYCGREGRVHEQVGPSTWFVMSWYRMESGRYEVVAYVS